MSSLRIWSRCSTVCENVTSRLTCSRFYRNCPRCCQNTSSPSSGINSQRYRFPPSRTGGTARSVPRPAIGRGRLARRHRLVDFFFLLAPLEPPGRLQRIFSLGSPVHRRIGGTSRPPGRISVPRGRGPFPLHQRCVLIASPSVIAGASAPGNALLHEGLRKGGPNRRRTNPDRSPRGSRSSRVPQGLMRSCKYVVRAP